MKFEYLMQESPTYSWRASRLTASPTTLSDPRRYILPRYNNDSQSPTKKPQTSTSTKFENLIYTFGGEVLYSKVIKESESKELTIDAGEQDSSDAHNVLRLKPKERQYSDLAIRDIKITC